MVACMSNSLESEMIVLVDKTGTKQLGTAPKIASHHSDTPLHLAFSVYLFDVNGNTLATKRALHKKVWPSVWTNSCCGHPAPGETMVDAIARRLSYELGTSVKDLRCVLPKYLYKTPPYKGVIEHEFCPVYFGFIDGKLKPNPMEVADLRWMPWADYVRELSTDNSNEWSWWSKDQLKLITQLPKILTQPFTKQ